MNSAGQNLFWDGNKPGTKFFGRLMSDPHMQNLFKQKWESFKQDNMDELKEYVEEYADIIALALTKDHDRWGQRNGSRDPSLNFKAFSKWMNARIDYIDKLVSTY